MGEDHLSSRSPHRRGQLEVLRMRLASNMDGQTWINRSVLAGVQMQQIGVPIPQSHLPPTEIPAIREDVSIQNPALSLLQGLMPKVASLNASTSQLLQPPTNPDLVLWLSQQLQDTYDRLKAWQEHIPQVWRYKTQANPLTTVAEPYPGRVFIHPNMTMAGIWTAFWLAKLSIIRSLMLLPPMAADQPITSKLQLRDDVLCTVDCICSSIPYMVGTMWSNNFGGDSFTPAPAIGAFFSTRALFICAQVPGLSQVQMDWILGCMYSIGHNRGVGQALVLREKLLVDNK